MKQIILYVAISQDGFMADKQGGVDWLPAPTPDPEDVFGYKALMDRIDTILMGSHSYEQALTFGEWAWPDKQTYVFTAPDSPTRKKFNATPSNLTGEQQAISLVHEDPASCIKKLHALPTKTDSWLLGGAALAQSFAKQGLIDEIVLTILPTTLGEGIPLAIPLDNFVCIAEKPCPYNSIQRTYLKSSEK